MITFYFYEAKANLRQHVIVAAKKKDEAPDVETNLDFKAVSTTKAAEMLTEFHKDWPELKFKVTTPDKLFLLISINPRVREWYLDRKEEIASISDLPAAMAEAGVTAEEWSAVKDSVEATREFERATSAEMSEKVARFKADVTAINARRKAYYDRLPALVQISRVTVNQLPLESAVEIILEDSVDGRKKKQKELIGAFQKLLVQQLKDGTYKNPF